MLIGWVGVAILVLIYSWVRVLTYPPPHPHRPPARQQADAFREQALRVLLQNRPPIRHRGAWYAYLPRIGNVAVLIRHGDADSLDLEHLQKAMQGCQARRGYLVSTGTIPTHLHTQVLWREVRFVDAHLLSQIESGQIKI